MHVSRLGPIHPPREDDPAPRRGGHLSTLAFVLCALLAMAGTILLSERGRGLALQCAEAPATCAAP
jgi:hypothetical protein